MWVELSDSCNVGRAVGELQCGKSCRIVTMWVELPDSYNVGRAVG